MIGWSVGRLTSPSLDSSRSSFLQMAWMSPASARIWIPLGASIRRERVGDSSLPNHNHSNHNNNVINGRGSPCWPPELQRIIVVEMTLFLHFSSSLVRIQRQMWLWCCLLIRLLVRLLIRLFVNETVGQALCSSDCCLTDLYLLLLSCRWVSANHAAPLSLSFPL